MNEISRNLMKKIDEYVEEHTNALTKGNSAQLAYPLIQQLAEENGMDPTDLLVDYLDHVSLLSKKMNQDSEDKIFSESEVDSDNFKLY